MSSSSAPISKKNSRSIAKAQPGCVGNRINAVLLFLVRFSSRLGKSALKDKNENTAKNQHSNHTFKGAIITWILINPKNIDGIARSHHPRI